MSENKKIIRFYDDKNELLKNTPLFIIAEKFDLEYYQLNSLNKITFNKFTWNGKEYDEEKDVEVNYDNSREYLIAFDVLWEKNNKALGDTLLKKIVKILKSESIKGIIVYTRMGAIDQVDSMRGKLKDCLQYSKYGKKFDDSYKVNDRFIKIGTTDPYMNIKSLVNLAEEIFKNTEGESNGRKESL